MLWQPTRLTRAQLEERRLIAGRLLRAKRLSQAEIARQLGVSRATVSRWNRRLTCAGAAGAALPHVVRAAVPAHGGAVAPALPCAQPRCRGGRVRHRALDAATDRRGDRADLWRAVPLPLTGTRLARPRLESPATAPAGQRAR